MYQEERRMLAGVCKWPWMPASLRGRSASQGEQFSQLISAFINNPVLDLPREKRKAAQAVFGRHLRALVA